MNEYANNTKASFADLASMAVTPTRVLLEFLIEKGRPHTRLPDWLRWGDTICYLLPGYH